MSECLLPTKILFPKNSVPGLEAESFLTIQKGITSASPKNSGLVASLTMMGFMTSLVI